MILNRVTIDLDVTLLHIDKQFIRTLDTDVAALLRYIYRYNKIRYLRSTKFDNKHSVSLLRITSYYFSNTIKSFHLLIMRLMQCNFSLRSLIFSFFLDIARK